MGLSGNNQAEAGTESSEHLRRLAFQSDEYITYAELDRLNQNVGELLHRLVDAYITMTTKSKEHGHN